MKKRFLLHCDVRNGTFTLVEQGESWRREFAELTEAIDWAAGLISEAAALTIYNDRGEVVTETAVTPRAGRK